MLPRVRSTEQHAGVQSPVCIFLVFADDEHVGTSFVFESVDTERIISPRREIFIPMFGLTPPPPFLIALPLRHCTRPDMCCALVTSTTAGGNLARCPFHRVEPWSDARTLSRWGRPPLPCRYSAKWLKEAIKTALLDFPRISLIFNITGIILIVLLKMEL